MAQILQTAENHKKGVMTMADTVDDPNVQQEGSFETGSDEFFKSASQLNYNKANAMFEKMMMHDTETRAQQTSNLAAMGSQAGTFAATLFADTMNKNDQLHNLSIQAMQNAIENGNFASKQYLEHSKLGADRMWNVDEQGFQVADILSDSKFADALAVALQKIVSDMASTKTE